MDIQTEINKLQEELEAYYGEELAEQDVVYMQELQDKIDKLKQQLKDQS